MASAAQTLANRANAGHSTGPRTPAGKTCSSANALRHGLTAARLVVRDDELDDLASLRHDLLSELAPQGAVESVTFNDLLHAAWNLHRFRRLEAEHGAAPEDPAAAAFLDRLGRYQARTQRAFYRALRELRTLQTNRALRGVKLGEEEESAVPVIADINELTKQSQSEVTAAALDMALKMVNYETGAFRLASVSELDPCRKAPAAPATPRQPLANPATRL